jgi:serine/threonine-protein kinase
MLVTPSVKLVQPLRSGGMATVWIAEHLTLKTSVVVKFISEQLAGNEEALTRFSREAAAAAAVKSPHVVQMFDHGIIDGTPFIVMELLEGEDLRTRLQRAGALSLGEVETIVSQTCKALGQAHRAGIVHRDIKPDNMFLCRSEDGEVFVKLLDFGIAKKDDASGMSATRTGSVMGTPYYMSPEQVIGLKNIDLRTDIWSLGVVAFEAMTGVKAFNGETLGALAVAITHGPMPVPSRCNPGLPPTIDEWFARACARDPQYRFASAKDMSSTLRGIVVGLPPTASGSLPRVSSSITVPIATVHRPGPPMANTTTSPLLAQAQYSQPPMKSPHPALVAGAVVGGLLVLALGGGAFYMLDKKNAASASAPAAVSLTTPAPPPVTVEQLAPLAAASDTAPIPDPVVHSATPITHTHPNPPPPASSTKPAASAPPKLDCTVPYYYDSNGNRLFRKECM